MVTVYADDVLVYAPALDEYGLLGLKAVTSATKSGTAEIIMPAGHPAYNAFINNRTVVTIHRAGELIFRGRVLYPARDYDNSKTIVCEGERGFLRDAIMEPYTYQAAPSVIFADIIRQYNAQVDDYKQFRVGAITAEDPNNYVRLECESAEPVADVIDKLVERVGGYITFSDSAGQRCINWLGTLDQESGQVIEFGENLMDFTATGTNENFATVIYPYGKKDENTGKRLDIAAVNGGKKYIIDEAAAAQYGRVAATVTWDDVTLASNLLTKARQYLAASKLVVTTLELTAVDLSIVDSSIDALRVGDNVRVRSTPHGVDDVFLLCERSYDFLDPSQDRVVLGKELATLTGADVSGDKAASVKIQQVAQQTGTVQNTYIVSGGSGGGGGSGGTGGGAYTFEIDANGDLILYYEDGTTPPNYTINSDGDLILTF